jgi:hypothetical protein
VVCLRNDGAENLELRKIYVVVPGTHSETHDFLRVVDESGEDYLYPRDYFAPVQVSDLVAKELRRKSDAIK